jgi:hypothetical protein
MGTVINKYAYAQYEQTLLDHVRKMKGIRHPKQLLDYQPVRLQRPV